MELGFDVRIEALIDLVPRSKSENHEGSNTQMT